MFRRARLGSRRGATIVEFAVAIPVLFFMTLGIVDLGNLMLARQRLVQATYAAGRYAAQGAAVVTDAEVAARARLALSTQGQPVDGLEVTVTRGVSGPDNIVTVQLSLPVQAAIGLIDIPTIQTQSFTFREEGA